ncbi:MAG: PIN domain-containing protein [Chitinophaga sp.]|uniref:PIN domain-containing protein n=1 Tax=Chitinophaga sp. TaxID=1869181 RepID=UPI0025C5D1F4|nr:PIN domain-containing protein [Chitinophaga sp.]MBV8251344.1 PIN domain-containing protein [Chitinophaga sp.]
MIKVYADTSVIGGCFDKEFKEYSLRLMEEFRLGSKRLVVSDLVMLELEPAREEIKLKIEEIPDDYKIQIDENTKASELAETYISEGAINSKDHNDALHIALATVNNIDILASWNFKHIVNQDRILQYNAINLRFGYNVLKIQTPLEILNPDNHEQTKTL